MLVNTIYVKAGWAPSQQFAKAETRSEFFTLPDGSKTDVPMMQGQLAAHITQTPQYVAVPIPANGQVNLTVVVPTGDQTPGVDRAPAWRSALSSLGDQTIYANVSLALPRFEARFGDISGKRCKRWA